MMTRIIAALGLAFLTGCAANTVSQDLPANHPASPMAEAAPPAPPSTTLSLSGIDPLASQGSSTSSGTESPAGAMNHATMHHGHGDAPMGMNAMPEASRNQSGQQLYACPMHPDVTSTNPNDRCPKCNMKINKPVKGKAMDAAAATQSTSEPSSHESHGGQH